VPPMSYNVEFPSGNAKEFDTHHLPWAHYTDVMTDPARKAKLEDLSKLDLATLDGFVYIQPNVLHEMHSASVADGDKWASGFYPPLLAALAASGKKYIVMSWTDEGKDGLYFALNGNGAKQGVVSNVAYTNDDVLRTIEYLLGLGSLGTGDAKGKVMSDLLAV
jgi:hypothetical protein